MDSSAHKQISKKKRTVERLSGPGLEREEGLIVETTGGRWPQRYLIGSTHTLTFLRLTLIAVYMYMCSWRTGGPVVKCNLSVIVIIFIRFLLFQNITCTCMMMLIVLTLKC